MNREKLIDQLNVLIGRCWDVAESLELAVREINQPPQRSWASSAQERIDFIGELVALVRGSGGRRSTAAI